MRLFVFYLSWKISLGILRSNKTIGVVDHFVKENAISSTPRMVLDNVKNLYNCSMTCSSVEHCYGFTHETTNCLLFYYQTFREYQSQPNESTAVQYVKQAKDCSELPPGIPSGIYKIYPLTQKALWVYCEMVDANGGWTVLQRRQDGSEDFFRYWADYKAGFGDLENEFWIGNEIMHSITSQKRYRIRFDLEDFDAATAYAEYEYFYVDSESMYYSLFISGYSGTAGDGLFHKNFQTIGVPFSARDVDHDRLNYSCAVVDKKCGWWFRKCSIVNPNGMYKPGVYDSFTMNWRPWRKNWCLRKTRMMIKP